MLVKNLADQYNLIFVLPEGEVFSFYLDSPINKESQFESFIAKEVVEKIDSAYRTVRNSKGRVIAGLSMGGHGAIYLATRHPDLFCAAGSMSGALELSLSKTSNNFRDLFVKILGPEGSVPDLYAANSVVNMIDKIKINGLKLVIDCGVDDFLIDANREMHKRLVNAKAPHDYTERPGGHTWDYWQNSLPYQVLFFYNVLKGNQVIVPVSK
jgi:S-formylglutathione hydrolase FrmB